MYTSSEGFKFAMAGPMPRINFTGEDDLFTTSNVLPYETIPPFATNYENARILTGKFQE